jgi:nucleotide-binding universal stress UspA family protein
VDDSDGARGALEWAVKHAAALGADIEAVHAYEFRPAWIDYDSGAEAIERWRERAATLARDQLHRVVAEIDEIVVPSDAAAALIDHAVGADLLVVGSRGRGAFSALLLGSVSRRCTEHAPCAVVVVPQRVS